MMQNSELRAMQHLLEEKDRKIAELMTLVQTNIESHQHALQEKITYYENILALMPGSVYWLNRDNIYMGCNDIQAQQIMLSSRHDIVGKRTYDLLESVEEAKKIDQLNTVVMETGIAHSDIERGMLPDGERVYFSQKVPLRDTNNDVIGLLGISIDISELKKTEAALTIAKELAEAANRAKIEFIANMSHDIRTPLSGVIGLSSLLKERLSDFEHKQFAHWIYQSGEQLLNLLNSILDVISAETVCEDDINEDTFDLRQCIDDIIQLERPTTMLKGIALNVEVDANVPKYIITDRTKLHRVLLNLLGNAIKFTQSGTILIKIGVLEEDLMITRLQFSVMDTGIGISIDQQAKVFERFFRANSSYDGVYSGYGVGLHIAHSYVALLGGELQFTSVDGEGSTFYFDLPVSVGHVESKKDLKKSPVNNYTCFTNNKKIHLLLVEDNAIALRIVELIATQMGCTYVSVNNGEDAYELTKTDDFDLIITDIGLPNMSGNELTMRIREREAALDKPTVPIIGLTAHAHAKHECIESGMNDVYCKPLTPVMLQSILSQYIHASINTSKPNRCQLGLPTLDSQMFELEHFQLLDLDHAVSRIGSRQILIDLLRLMVKQELPCDEQQLRDAYAIGDWDAIEKIAHKMKGGAVYCGTFKLQYACQYLERYKKAGYTELLDKLYHQLLDVMHKTQKSVLHLISN